MEGPCPSCTDPQRFSLLKKLEPQADFCHCPDCSRKYVLAELTVDAMCIETIEQKIWKEMDDPPQTGDVIGYLLDHRPYFASSRGGDFYAIAERMEDSL